MLVSTLLLASALVGGENILANSEFTDDRLGGVLNWSLVRPSVDGLLIKSKEGPDGSTALALSSRHPRGLQITQSGIRLVAGESYRLSVDVRTRGLKGSDMRLELHNEGWQNPSYRLPFPSDTDGAWRRIELRIDGLLKSAGNVYHLEIYTSRPLSDGASVEIARPELVALTKTAMEGSAPPIRQLRKEHFRIVPISPKLMEVDPLKGEMEFFYPADLDKDFSAYLLTAYVDGIRRSACPFSSTRRVKLELGELVTGDHTLVVNLTEAETGRLVDENVYPIRVGRPETYSVGRELNGFVTELLREPLGDREYAFTNPKTGFVALALSGTKGSAVARIDGGMKNVVRLAPDGVLRTMLHLSAGRHTLAVSGADGGELTVRAVKPLTVSGGAALADRPSDIGAYEYEWDFWNRFVYPWCNTLSIPRTILRSAQLSPNGGLSGLAERGIRILSPMNLGPRSAARNDPDGIVAAITNSPCWQLGLDVLVDENAVQVDCLNGRADNHAEAEWMLNRHPQAVSVFWADGVVRTFDNPRLYTSLLAAIVNSGCGRGYNLLEAYAVGVADEQTSRVQEDGCLAFARSVADLVPAAKGSVYYHFNNYNFPGAWCGWGAPEADYRVLTDRLVHRLATDPAFQGHVYGVGTSAFHHTDEEMVRWSMALVRHYGIEGRTERLSDLYGYRYNPGYVANPDFAQGLAGWTVRPAAADSLRAMKIEDFGKKAQGRVYQPKGTGDGVALFTRMADHPNRLSQKISGLAQGHLYALVFFTVDYDEYLKRPGVERSRHQFRADFTGGANVPALESHCPGARFSYSRPGHLFIYRHRYVFRADSTDVTLTFLDRSPDEGETITEGIGRRHLLNFVHLHEYFLGDTSIEELATFARKM